MADHLLIPKSRCSCSKLSRAVAVAVSFPLHAARRAMGKAASVWGTASRRHAEKKLVTASKQNVPLSGTSFFPIGKKGISWKNRRERQAD
jgi:hypothetical protein